MRKADPGGPPARRRPASMGPQLDSCGRTKMSDVLRRAGFASMGPQLDSCGRSAAAEKNSPLPQLQWGRNLIVAEGLQRSVPARHVFGASMGPQLDSCGRQDGRPPPQQAGYHASMGPQLDSCGRQFRVGYHKRLYQASMGPQLDSCGRCRIHQAVCNQIRLLQWGRNLIVAEGTR